jgi:hypothetical protein
MFYALAVLAPKKGGEKMEKRKKTITLTVILGIFFFGCMFLLGGCVAAVNNSTTGSGSSPQITGLHFASLSPEATERIRVIVEFEDIDGDVKAGYLTYAVLAPDGSQRILWEGFLRKRLMSKITGKKKGKVRIFLKIKIYGTPVTVSLFLVDAMGNKSKVVSQTATLYLR